MSVDGSRISSLNNLLQQSSTPGAISLAKRSDTTGMGDVTPGGSVQESINTYGMVLPHIVYLFLVFQERSIASNLYVF